MKGGCALVLCGVRRDGDIRPALRVHELLPPPVANPLQMLSGAGYGGAKHKRVRHLMPHAHGEDLWETAAYGALAGLHAQNWPNGLDGRSDGIILNPSEVVGLPVMLPSSACFLLHWCDWGYTAERYRAAAAGFGWSLSAGMGSGSPKKNESLGFASSIWVGSFTQ